VHRCQTGGDLRRNVQTIFTSIGLIIRYRHRLLKIWVSDGGTLRPVATGEHPRSTVSKRRGSSRSGKAIDLDRLVAALHLHQPQRFSAVSVLAGLAQHFGRDEELRTALLVELLDPRGEDYHVAAD
jgi:hypothetical protein